jgi:O-antigen/teichoic acid export membrane protein
MPPDADAQPHEVGQRDLRLVARQGTLQFAGSLANAFFAFLLVVVAARALGPTMAGAFLVSIAAFQVLASLTVMGSDIGLIRSIPRLLATRRSSDVRPMLLVGLVPVGVVGTACGIAAFALAPEVAEILSDRDPGLLLPFVRTLAPFIPLAALTSACLGATRGFGTVIPSVSIELVAKPASRPVLLGAAVALGLGSVAVAMSYALPILIGVVAAMLWLRRLLPAPADAHGPTTGTASLARSFWAYAVPRGLQAFVTTTTLWLDVMLLSAMRSTAEAAVYTAAARFLVAGEAALHAVVAVISPQISRLLATEDRAGAKAMYQTSTWWLMTLTWPMFLAMAVYAPLLLRLFGPSFQEGEAALTILALASLVSMATGPAGAVLLMAGHSMLGLVVGSATLVLNLALNLVLIPRYGMTGSAWAWAISIVLANLAGALLLRRLERMSPIARGTAIVAVSSLLAFGALGLAFRWLFGTGLASFVAYAALATAAYVAALHRFRRELRFRLFLEALRSRGQRGPEIPPEGAAQSM